MIDNDREFDSQVVDQWAYENRVRLHFHHAGAAPRIEINGKFRDECLNEN